MGEYDDLLGRGEYAPMASDDWRVQAEAAQAKAAEMEQWRERAEKAEAEVAQLSSGARCPQCSATEWNQSSIQRQRAEASEVMVAELLRLAQHLVSEHLYEGGWCDLASDLGGQCPEEKVAVRWEHGFADAVCEHHAETARSRGALVIYPRRHDGNPTTEEEGDER